MGERISRPMKKGWVLMDRYWGVCFFVCVVVGMYVGCVCVCAQSV